MVEAGILAAVAIVMALIAIYIPVLGAFVNFIWPLPIIACGVRNGFKWALLTTIVAGLIAAMIINPLQAFILVAVFGILGLVLGECMRRNSNPLTILAFGSIGAIAGMKVFHHKTKHWYFRFGIPAILLVQLAAAVWWFYLR